jgi:hypothetical protein
LSGWSIMHIVPTGGDKKCGAVETLTKSPCYSEA